MREYPHASLYAHTVGFSSLLFGDSGIESSYATKLTSGRDLTVSGIINALLGQDLRARSLQLTLNHRLQETAARALGDRRGAVVALEPASGQVLAMVSSPTFDPNSLIGVDTEPAWDALAEDVARPLENRATGRSLPGKPLPEDLVLPGPDPAAGAGTALEIALRTAAMAREGRLMRPYLVARVFDGDSNLESETVPVLHSEPISTADAAVLADRMEQLAIDSARLGEVRGAGETGVGTGPAGRRHVWFSGYVPAGEPLIVVAVVVEPVTGARSKRHGGPGGRLDRPRRVSRVVGPPGSRWSLAGWSETVTVVGPAARRRGICHRPPDRRGVLDLPPRESDDREAAARRDPRRP